MPLGRPVQIGDFKLIIKGQLPKQASDTFVLSPERRKRNLIRGKLEATPVEQLLISIEEKNKSGCVEIESEEFRGSVSFHAGQPYRASTNEGHEGVDAIRRLLEVEHGTFAIDPNPVDPGERKISRGFNEIILEDFFERG